MVAELYERVVVDELYLAGVPCHLQWDAHVFRRLIEDSSLPSRVIHKAYALRLMSTQPCPPIEVNPECYYYGIVHPKLQVHVFTMCPQYFLLHAKHYVECVATSGLQLQGTLYDGHAFVPCQGPYNFRYVPDQPLCPDSTRHGQLGVTLMHTGLRSLRDFRYGVQLLTWSRLLSRAWCGKYHRSTMSSGASPS